MSNSFGPWATSIDPLSQPALSTYWKQRFALLRGAADGRGGISRREFLALGAAGFAAAGLPTLRAGAASAQNAVPAHPEKPRKKPDERDEALILESRRKLVRIGLAMWNYRDATLAQTFPPPVTVPPGRQRDVSWRVMLLPYLGEIALYKRYRFEEPWDSDHNRQLIDQMPDAYKVPRDQPLKLGHTSYLLPYGEKTMCPSDGAAYEFDVAQLSEELRSTVLVVEADFERAVPWTTPQDLKIESAKPLAGLPAGSIVVLLVEGTTAVIPMPLRTKSGVTLDAAESRRILRDLFDPESDRDFPELDIDRRDTR